MLSEQMLSLARGFSHIDSPLVCAQFGKVVYMHFAGPSRARGWASWYGASQRSITMLPASATSCKHLRRCHCAQQNLSRSTPGRSQSECWAARLRCTRTWKRSQVHASTSLTFALHAQEAVDRLRSAAHSADASLKLGAQSLSNMLYAYALLNHHPGTQLLSAIAVGVQWQLRDFSPQVHHGSKRSCWCGTVLKCGTVPQFHT